MNNVVPKKLLILTQKVDPHDTDLGFFHEWIRLFAGKVDKVTVLALSVGPYTLPSNVEVISLGKEKKVSRLQYLFRFYKTIWEKQNEYDTVFVHMNPIYVVLGGVLWRAWGKKIIVWYTHRHVDLKLRIAVFFADKIFTAGAHSMRIDTPKKEVLGHGIDTNYFSCPLRAENDLYTILHVGRITSIKNIDTILSGVQKAQEKSNKKIRLVFIGDPVTRDDEILLKKFKKSISSNNEIVWNGGVPQRELKEWYCKADLTINATPTGGIDKVVLESLSCGVPVLTSNETFAELFKDQKGTLLFTFRNESTLAEKIEYWVNKTHQESTKEILPISERVRTQYTLENLIQKILSYGFQ